MEGVSFLVLLVIFVIAASIRKTVRRKRWKKRRSASVRFEPFDAKSASAKTFSKVLHGPAYIVDGDTLVIRKTQIRLFGIDAPEINHPYGKKAKWALVSICRAQIIQAEIVEQDSYGRTVARCYLEDGRDLSAEMVKLGLAIDWKKFSGGIYRPLEIPNIRKKLWLADARQKGRMHVWKRFDAYKNSDPTDD